MDDLIKDALKDVNKYKGMTKEQLQEVLKEQRKNMSDAEKVGGTVATTTRMLYQADMLINVLGDKEEVSHLIRRTVHDLLALAEEFGISTEQIAAAVEIKADRKKHKDLLSYDYSYNFEELLDKATGLLEKCIREGVRDDD